MKEKNVSKAYAQSIFELGKEHSIDVASELTKLTEVINSSNELETLLFLDVFTPEEKSNVLDEITSKLSFSTITKHFLSFLLEEKRINILPVIYKDLIVLDDHEKGFLRGTIEGAEDQVDPLFQQKISAYLYEKLGKKTELGYMKSNRVTAGYRVTVEDLQLDASVDNQLEQLKTNILNA